MERARDQQLQVVEVHRLGEEVERAFLHREHGVLDAAVGRHHDDRQIRIEIFGRAQHAEAIASGEPEIGQHQVGTRVVQAGQSFGLVAGLDDGVPLLLERGAKHRPQRVFVLDQQNGEHALG